LTGYYERNITILSTTDLQGGKGTRPNPQSTRLSRIAALIYLVATKGVRSVKISRFISFALFLRYGLTCGLRCGARAIDEICMIQLLRIGLGAVFLAVLSACSHGSDEEQIRAVVGAAETAAETRSTSGVMKWIADDYRDDLGSDKTQLQNILRAYFLSHPKIELLVNIKDVKIESPNSARAHIELTMLGTEQRSDSSASLTAESQPLRVDFRRIDSEWRVVSVERRRD